MELHYALINGFNKQTFMAYLIAKSYFICGCAII